MLAGWRRCQRHERGAWSGPPAPVVIPASASRTGGACTYGSQTLPSANRIREIVTSVRGAECLEKVKVLLEC